MLADYDGTLLLVSHDRDFLDRLVTSVIAVEGDGVIEEYVGGYSDYLRQRPAAAPPSAAETAGQGRGARRPKQATKLGRKEQRELDALPAQIAAFESEKTRLEAALADRAFYARDRAAFEASSSRHAALVEALARAEERWLALAGLAEELSRASR